LNKNSKDRYSSAAALEADLRHWLAGEPLSIYAPAITSLLRLWLRQNFGAAGWTVVIGVALGVMCGILLWASMFQGIVADQANVYELFPSMKRPLLLRLDWSVPQWLANLFAGLAVLLFGFLGLLTAALVRPKNRNADIVAGLLAAVVAGFASFVMFFGPFGVHVRLGNLKDVEVLSRAAFSESARVIDELLRMYPDMQHLPRDQRASVLFRKIIADELANVRFGIWGSLFASMVICAVVGVGETLIAGPLLRRFTWYRAIVPYTELAVPVAALTYVGGNYLFAAMLGPVGIFGASRIVLAVAAMLLTIWAAIRRWHWTSRIALQLLCAVCFLDIVINHNRHILRVGWIQSSIAAAERRAATSFENVDVRLDLGMSHAELAYYWLRHEKWRYAVHPFEMAVDVYYSVHKQGVGDERRHYIESQLSQWLPDLIKTYGKLGRFDDSEELIAKFDPLAEYNWHFIATLLRSHCRAMSADGGASQQACADYVSKYVRGKLATADSATCNELTSRLITWINTPGTWDVIGPFPGRPSKGLDTAYGPERSAEPKRQYMHGANILQWRPVSACAGDYIDLASVVAQEEFVVAYASTVFESPIEQNATLLIGSDDGCKIWLNDELVSEVRMNRRYRPAEDRIPVTLRKGANRLLIKIEQATEAWGFSCDVVDAEGWPSLLTRHTGPFSDRKPFR
jgi:hypothetical protein